VFFVAKFLFEPRIFQRIVDIFVDRYRHLEIDVIAGYVVFLVCLCGCGAAEETQAVGSRGFFPALAMHSRTVNK